MKDWTRPVVGEVRSLVVNGFGVWLGACGWLLLSSSNAIVIAAVGQAEWIAIFSCTAKISVVALQLVWLMPDSGLVGLAQLSGEPQRVDRVRYLVGLLQQVHLLLAGAAACAVLAFNPTFVNYWVGAPLFGGLGVNALLAATIVLYSLGHGLVTTASVVGNRVHVGIVTVLNGAVQVVAALALGRWLGLGGVVLGGLLAAAVTSVPAGLFILRRSIGISVRDLMAERVVPWAARMAPVAAVASLVGAFHAWLGFWLAAAATALVALVYVWHMRPLYGAVLALDPRWTSWFAMAGLTQGESDPEPASAVLVHHS
jgi:hypothetical protein